MRQSIVDRWRLYSLTGSVQWLHGPSTLLTNQTEAIVLCVVKDSETLIEAFIEHYLSAGFKHIFFLDNGSTDKTIDIIKTYSQTTVVRSQRPFKDYYVVFKNYLIQQFGGGKWCLIADVDEFFHLPLQRCLQHTLSYLNRHQYDTVCVQMLDMFSSEGIALTANGPIKNAADCWSLDKLKAKFQYYDLTSVRQTPYVRSFVARPPAGLQFTYGGIRKAVFGSNCFLTKEALFYTYARHGLGRLLPRLRYLESSHLLFSMPFSQVKLADFSALFLHYKFIDGFYAATQAAVLAENHWNSSREYKTYQQVMTKAEATGQTLTLKRPTAQILEEIDVLVEQGFLFASEQFRQAEPSSL
ncbi:MAG: glycosyltransferase family 2 protein [Cyanobacteria bacterium J06607_10]